MKCLLDNKLAPLTFNWAFLQAPLDTVVEGVKQWREGYGRNLKLARLRVNLKDQILSLLPLTMPRNKELFLETKLLKWTAYFDNSRIGGDIFSPTRYLARSLGCVGVAVGCVPNTKKGTYDQSPGIYGAVQMHACTPHDVELSNCLRSIAAANDGGKWVFHVHGEIQPWERPDKYQTKRIVDRFPPELLEEYCRHFGLDIFSPAFYGPAGVLVASDEPVATTQSLESRQREMGLTG